MAAATCVISYVMLDDLQPIEPPTHTTIPRTKESLIEFIRKIKASYTPYDSKTDAANGKSDPTCLFNGEANKFGDMTFSDGHISEIADELLREGYWVMNRVNKYYVVAFALDGTKFHVYSKDCDPEIVNWGAGIPEGAHKGPILTAEDNIN